MYKFLLLCIEVPIILKLRVILFILNLINILMNSLDTAKFLWPEGFGAIY